MALSGVLCHVHKKILPTSGIFTHQKEKYKLMADSPKADYIEAYIILLWKMIKYTVMIRGGQRLVPTNAGSWIPFG